MMINGYEGTLTNIYEKIRENEKKSLDARRKEISEKYPEISQLDSLIQKKSLGLYDYSRLKLTLKTKIICPKN